MLDAVKTHQLRNSFSLDDLDVFQDPREPAAPGFRSKDDTVLVGRPPLRNRASIRFTHTGDPLRIIQSRSETCTSATTSFGMEGYRSFMNSSTPNIHMNSSEARSHCPVLQFHLPFRQFHFDIDAFIDNENGTITRADGFTENGHGCKASPASPLLADERINDAVDNRFESMSVLEPYSALDNPEPALGPSPNRHRVRPSASSSFLSLRHHASSESFSLGSRSHTSWYSDGSITPLSFAIGKPSSDSTRIHPYAQSESIHEAEPNSHRSFESDQTFGRNTFGPSSDPDSGGASILDHASMTETIIEEISNARIIELTPTMRRSVPSPPFSDARPKNAVLVSLPPNLGTISSPIDVSGNSPHQGLSMEPFPMTEAYPMSSRRTSLDSLGIDLEAYTFPSRMITTKGSFSGRLSPLSSSDSSASAGGSRPRVGSLPDRLQCTALSVDGLVRRSTQDRFKLTASFSSASSVGVGAGMGDPHPLLLRPFTPSLFSSDCGHNGAASAAQRNLPRPPFVRIHEVRPKAAIILGITTTTIIDDWDPNAPPEEVFFRRGSATSTVVTHTSSSGSTGAVVTRTKGSSILKRMANGVMHKFFERRDPKQQGMA